VKLLIKISISFLIISINAIQVTGQEYYIRTKGGQIITERGNFISMCLTSLHKDSRDETAYEICSCEAIKVDHHFSYQQYKRHTKDGLIDLNGLFKEDSTFEKEIEACYTNSGKTVLIQAEGFQDKFVTNCMKNLQKNSIKELDSNRLYNFCSCQMDLFKTKQISDEEVKLLQNPNSLFFYEMISKCGNPFSDDERDKKNWNRDAIKDIIGPDSDTIGVLSMNGMTYLKAKTGNMVQVWLFDTGASDLLINNDMEQTLKNQKILNDSNYIGVGIYEMANGVTDSCRKYKMNNIRVGKFTVNNVVVAVTDKGKKIIIGRSLLNKFGNWILDNKKSVLILSK